MKKVLSKSFWVDRDIEQFIGELLRYGVVISSIIVLLGGVMYLHLHGSAGIPPYHVFIGEPKAFTTFSGIFKGTGALSAPEFIQFGVLVLIATPVLRIAFSLVAFLVEKDKLYVVITFIVLCVMMVSIFGGLKV
jgi:uncharacterized membrane protein